MWLNDFIMKKIILTILLLYVVLDLQAQFSDLHEYGLPYNAENLQIMKSIKRLEKTQRIGSIMAISGLASACIGYIAVSTTTRTHNHFRYIDVVRGDDLSVFLFYGGLTSMVIGFPMWAISAKRLEYFDVVIYLKQISQPSNGGFEPIPVLSLNIKF